MKKTMIIVSGIGLFLAINAMVTRAQETSRGSEVFQANCGKCHLERNPKEYSDDEWRTIIMQMRIRAGLTGEEARAVLGFLQQEN